MAESAATRHRPRMTQAGLSPREEKPSGRTVAAGCGQGAVFSCALDKLYDVRLPPVSMRRSTIYDLLRAISQYNAVRKRAAAVEKKPSGCQPVHRQPLLSPRQHGAVA